MRPTSRNMYILDSDLPCLECIAKFFIITLKNKMQGNGNFMVNEYDERRCSYDENIH